jgi:hypothetical protein
MVDNYNNEKASGRTERQNKKEDAKIKKRRTSVLLLIEILFMS